MNSTQVHDAATDEVRAGTVERAGEGNPGDTECQVHQVVQDRHVEDSEKCGVGVMAGEGELVVVRGDARNEAEHADDQKHRADCEGSFLYRRPKFGRGSGRVYRMGCGHLFASISGLPTVLRGLEANGSGVIPVPWPCKRRCTELVCIDDLVTRTVARCAARVVEGLWRTSRRPSDVNAEGAKLKNEYQRHQYCAGATPHCA